MPESDRMSLSSLDDDRDASPPRFEILDGLRAIAFLAVFGYHFGLPVRPVMSFAGVGFRIIPNLDLGVEIFFVLSGFLIFRPFAAANLKGTPFPSWRAYAIRRALRIFPAYWAALTAFLVLGEVEVHGGFWMYVAHYSLVHTYLPESLRTAFDGLGPSWSLVVEVSFYSMVPFVGWALRRASIRRHLFTMAVLTLFGYSMRVITVFHPLNGKFGGWLKSFVGVLPVALAALAPGMAIAVVSVAQPRWALDLFRRVWVWWSFALACFVALMFAAPTSAAAPFRQAGSAPDLWHRILTPVVAFALVAPCVLGDGNRSRLFAILRNRVLAWIGVVSYGAYLWHHPLLLDSPGDRIHLSYFNMLDRSIWYALLLAFGFLVATVYLAGASWLQIERPAQNLARRLVTRFERPRTG